MAESRRTSLKDLAQILGVSIPTVSRALKIVPKSVGNFVLKLKIGKRDELSPQSFCYESPENTPRTIGVIVPDIVTHFFASILSGIEDTAIANGYLLSSRLPMSHTTMRKEILRIWSICMWKVL